MKVMFVHNEVGYRATVTPNVRTQYADQYILDVQFESTSTGISANPLSDSWRTSFKTTR